MSSKDAEDEPTPDPNEAGQSSGSGGAAGCIIGLVIMILPILMFQFSPAEGGMGWTGVMILPFTTVIGGIIGIVGLVSVSRSQNKSDGDK